MGLSERRSRRSRTFIDCSGWPWLTSILFAPPITAATDGSVRRGWVGITKGGFVCCAISTLARVAVDWKRSARQPTGAVWRWRNSAEWSCSKVHGKPPPTIPARRPASRKWTWTRKISLPGSRRRRGSEIAAQEVGGRGQSATWRSSADYAVRDGRGDPRGRKSGGGSGADSPTWPARAEGEKRFRSAIRNPYAAIHKVA